MLFNSISNLPNFKDYKLKQVSSYDRTGGNKDFIKIKKGSSVEILNVKGTGCIVRIWLTLFSPDVYILRRALIKIYWDDEEHPSVEVPIGDFFGVGFCYYIHYSSLLLGMTSGGFYCYFPMPYEKSAKVIIENQSPFDIPAFYYHIEYQELKELNNVGRFHAKWRRETTERGKNYLMLQAKGRGHYIGCNMSMQCKKPNSFYFLEGDEMIYVDGEGHPPSIHGTGTEDYFNSGWYYNKDCFHSAFHGLTYKKQYKSRICTYRHHILDPIPFEKEISVTIEHGGTNDAEGSDYCSVAYWYQDEPHYEFYKMPPADERLPKDGIIERNYRFGKNVFFLIGHFIWEKFISKLFFKQT